MAAIGRLFVQLAKEPASERLTRRYSSRLPGVRFTFSTTRTHSVADLVLGKSKRTHVMSRTPRPEKTSRSEHWLRVLVNEHPELLDAELRRSFGWSESEEVTWVSPLANDEYAEYRDAQALEKLGLTPSVPLAEFWPTRGPRWDALGRTSAGRPLLVEAKAYIEEIVSPASAASDQSLTLIRQSLREVKEFLRIKPEHDWSALFYQYTNRLAHLYYLRRRNSVDAYLVFIYFLGAPDVQEPSTAAEWHAALRLLKSLLGTSRHALTPYIAEVFIDVSELQKT